MKTKLAFIVLAWSVTASADERKFLSLASIASTAAFPVHGDAGLAGLHDGARAPANWVDDHEELTSCSRNRRASVTNTSTSEITSANGRDYLDSGTYEVSGDVFKVLSHERREVTLVATIGEASVWAYREHGTLHFGAFADFGMISHGFVAFGCQWNEVVVPESGGIASMFSTPSMSDPPPGFFQHPVPKATGPTFSFAVSLSRSATDTEPLVVMRTR